MGLISPMAKSQLWSHIFFKLTLQYHLSLNKGWKKNWAPPGLVGRIPYTQTNPMQNKNWVIPITVHVSWIGTVSYGAGVALSLKSIFFSLDPSVPVRKNGVEDKQDNKYCGCKTWITLLFLERYLPPHLVAIGLIMIPSHNIMKPMNFLVSNTKKFPSLLEFWIIPETWEHKYTWVNPIVVLRTDINKCPKLCVKHYASWC